MAKEQGIRPQGVRENFYNIFVRGSELSKKFDVAIFAVGGVLLFVNPAVGAVIIGGNAATYVAADRIENGAKGRMQELQAKRLGSKSAPQRIDFRRAQYAQAA